MARIMEQEDKSFWEYKTGEHQRVNTVIYGAGLAAILAISHIGKNENTGIFITAFIWALISYAYWFFAEGHISDDANPYYRKVIYKKVNLNVNAKKLTEDKLKLMDRCRNRNLYTLMASWVLNISGASLYFFHNTELPHWVGWILIYGSIPAIFLLILWEYKKTENWDNNCRNYIYSIKNVDTNSEACL